MVQPDEQEAAIEYSMYVFEEGHAYAPRLKASLAPVRIRHMLLVFAALPKKLPDVAARRFCSLASAYRRIAGPGALDDGLKSKARRLLQEAGVDVIPELFSGPGWQFPPGVYDSGRRC